MRASPEVSLVVVDPLGRGEAGRVAAHLVRVRVKVRVRVRVRGWG